MDTRSQHLLVDAVLSKKISASDIEAIKNVIEKNLTVVNRIEHKFEPEGETIAFILAESHFTLHTYPEHNYISFDIYVCNLDVNLEKILLEIRKVVPFNKMDSNLLFRGKITLQEEQSKLRFIYLLTVLVAMGSILYEFLLAQSLSTTMGNTALRYNLTIGIYIASMGFGALFYKKIIKGDLFTSFVKIEVLLSVVGGVAPILVLICDYLFNVLATRTGLPFYGPFIQWPIFTLNHFLIIAIGFISGLELPLLIEMGSKFQLQKSHRILALDYLGTLIGAIAFPILILPKFHIFTIGFMVSFINIMASIIVAYKMEMNHRKLKYILGLFLILWAFLLYYSTSINEFIVDHFYFGGRL
jgi:S-adenosylmethionine/arginine decarboxylase-like enzyme